MTEEKRRVGEIRPSQLLFTYGIGAIVDLPELSVIFMGVKRVSKNATGYILPNDKRSQTDEGTFGFLHVNFAVA